MSEENLRNFLTYPIPLDSSDEEAVPESQPNQKRGLSPDSQGLIDLRSPGKKTKSDRMGNDEMDTTDKGHNLPEGFYNGDHKPDPATVDTFRADLKGRETVNIELIYSLVQKDLILILEKPGGVERIQSLVNKGKSLSQAIQKTVESGKQYLEVEGMYILADAKNAGPNVLTKQRFMACLHRFMHQVTKLDKNFRNSFTCSPLVGFVDFDDDLCTVKDIKLLLGAGFQYQHKVVTDKIDFFIGCAMLDYLATKSSASELHAKYGDKSFADYLAGPELAGNVVSGAAGTMNDTAWACLTHPKAWREIIDRAVQIKFRGSASMAREAIRAGIDSLRKKV